MSRFPNSVCGPTVWSAGRFAVTQKAATITRLSAAPVTIVTRAAVRPPALCTTSRRVNVNG